MLLRECAAGGVTRWQPCAGARRCATAPAASSSTPTRGSVARRRDSSSPPAASRSRRSAPATSATGSRASSASARRAAPGAGAADLRRPARGRRSPRSPGVSLPVRVETGREGAARGRLRRRPAVHAPRPERPGGAADLELLAAGRAARIDLAPGVDLGSGAARSQGELARQLGNELADVLPRRLAEAWLRRALGLPARGRWPSCATATCGASPPRCSAGSCVPSGTEGYRKAEVTAGGVDTRELTRKPWKAGACRACTSSARWST